MSSTLGQIISTNRRRRGWTQWELAGKIDVSQTRVSQMETSFDESIGRQKIAALIQVFNYPPDLVAWWAGDQLDNLDRTLNRAHGYKRKVRIRPESDAVLAKLEELVDRSRKVYTELNELREWLQQNKAS